MHDSKRRSSHCSAGREKAEQFFFKKKYKFNIPGRQNPALFPVFFCESSHTKPELLVTTSSTIVTRMQPPSRTTRSTNNPGAVDLPKACRSPAEAAAEKAKKKETAIANTKKKQEQVARLVRVEQEIKIAQKEPVQTRVQGRVKKTFSQETPVGRVKEVPPP